MKNVISSCFLIGLMIGLVTFGLTSSATAQKTSSASYVKTVEVDVLDNFFSSSSVEVQVGDTVRWMNKGFNAHNVIATGGAFDSGAESSASWTYEFTPTTAGTYEYFCAPHQSQGMTGAVVVKERYLNMLPVIIKPGPTVPAPTPDAP